jgi:hypothetical protein
VCTVEFRSRTEERERNETHLEPEMTKNVFLFSFLLLKNERKKNDTSMRKNWKLHAIKIK